MAAIYALLSQDRRAGMKQKTSDVKAKLDLRKAAREEARYLMQKAEEDAKKGGFLRDVAESCSTIGMVAAIVGSVAVAVGTGGAGAPFVFAVAGAVLSSAAFVQNQSHVLQKWGMSKKAAGWTEFGLSMGAGACSLGAAATQVAAAKSAQEAAKVGSDVQRIGRAAGVAAGGVSGVATIGSGAATWRAGVADGASQNHMADALKANLRAQQLSRLIDQVLTEIEDSDKEDQRTMSHLQKAIEIKGQTLTMISGRV